jgi:hypothetical protein
MNGERLLIKELLQGPLSESATNVRLDAWMDQIREATLEASKSHRDAVSIELWEQSGSTDRLN